MDRRLFLLIALILLVQPISASTYLFYTTNATDGSISRIVTNSTWQSIRDGVGNSYADYDTYTDIRVMCDRAANSVRDIIKGFFQFNTSAIPDTENVTSANISLYRRSSTTDLGDSGIGIVKINSANVTLNAADYKSFGSVLLSPYQNVSTMTTGKYYHFPFTNSLDYISKTGNTSIGARIQMDIENTSPTYAYYTFTRVSIYTANYVLYPPILTVETDTTPPNAVSNLANSTPSCGESNITWTNPFDSDLAVIEILINGTIWDNQSASATHRLLTGLPASEPMTINISTKDASGNRNTTHIQSLSFTTGSCAIPPVSSISCYFTNITGVSLGWNTSEWNITQGQWTWGTWITNVTQGNISYYSCYDESVTPTPTPTPTPTITLTWTPEINPPSRDSLTGTIKEWIKKFLKDVFE